MNMDNIFVLLIEQEGDFCMFYVHPLALAILLGIMTQDIWYQQTGFLDIVMQLTEAYAYLTI